MTFVKEPLYIDEELSERGISKEIGYVCSSFVTVMIWILKEIVADIEERVTPEDFKREPL